MYKSSLLQNYDHFNLWNFLKIVSAGTLRNFKLWEVILQFLGLGSCNTDRVPLSAAEAYSMLGFVNDPRMYVPLNSSILLTSYLEYV